MEIILEAIIEKLFFTTIKYPSLFIFDKIIDSSLIPIIKFFLNEYCEIETEKVFSNLRKKEIEMVNILSPFSYGSLPNWASLHFPGLGLAIHWSILRR